MAMFNDAPVQNVQQCLLFFQRQFANSFQYFSEGHHILHGFPPPLPASPTLAITPL